MEGPVHNFPTEYPSRKRWFEPSTIISDKELKQSDETDSVEMADSNCNKSNETVKRIRQHMFDIQILSEENSTNFEQQTSRLSHKNQNQCSKRPEAFRTPKSKCHVPQLYKCNSHTFDSSSILCDKSDWMLAERSSSRSPPSPVSRSPISASRSPMMHHVPHSPDLRKNCDIFNFSQERTELYSTELETQPVLVKTRNFEDIPAVGTTLDHHTNKEPMSPVCCIALTSPAHRQMDILMPPRQLIERDSRDIISSRRQQGTVSQYYCGCISSPCEHSGCCSDAKPYLAKRQIDVDTKYVITSKRLKFALEREMGQSYLQQLTSDISDIKKSSNCTCVIMERQFLEMAESAYRSVRRLDASPRGFEQFRRELIQTNEVMKASMEVLKNITRFCEHKCNTLK